MLQRLYVRIWLSVLLTVAVLMLLLGWVWQVTTDPPVRTMVVQDMAGNVIGQGAWRGNRDHAGKLMQPADGDPAPVDPRTAQAQRQLRSGPDFLIQMRDGQELVVHMPRPPRSIWSRPPTGFLWVLGLVGIGAALVMYPVARRLTRRLERLQSSVRRWGEGDLSARVPLSGGDEVGYLAQHFNNAAERIEQLVRAQKSLLGNASHELRSPLARIRMGLELMGEKPTPALREEIRRNIAELDQLVEEILLSSRLDAQEADLGTVEDVDWTGLTAEECARLDVGFEVMGAAGNTGDTADPSGAGDADAPPVLVRGVPRLLRRVVRNLLENARRYGQGEVKATLEQHDGLAVLKVFDRGPGVPAPLRHRIFEPFYRLPGASESNGGVGLGLALVKSIAERHGGTVRCEEREGGGACFVVVLPT